MVKLAVTCAIGCAALLLSSSIACQRGKHGPVIVFDSTRFDFGAALEGEVLTHAFTFTNTGERSLQRGRRSCGPEFGQLGDGRGEAAWAGAGRDFRPQAVNR